MDKSPTCRRVRSFEVGGIVVEVANHTIGS